MGDGKKAIVLPSLSFMEIYIKFMATQVGRDKVYRTIQYGSRFLIALLLRFGLSSTKSSLIKRLAALSSAIGLARKRNKIWFPMSSQYILLFSLSIL